MYGRQVDDEVAAVHWRTKEVVVEILTGQEHQQDHEDLTTDTSAVTTTSAAGEEQSTASRRRRAAAATSYHVDVVSVDPPVKDGRLRTPVVATDQGQKNTPNVCHDVVTKTHMFSTYVLWKIIFAHSSKAERHFSSVAYRCISVA